MTTSVPRVGRASSRVSGWWHVPALGVWIVWAAAHLLPSLLVVDEIEFAYWAKHPLISLPHPPLYMGLLAGMHYGLQVPDAYLRLLGMVTTGLASLATYRLAQRWKPGAGKWALWLLWTNPLLVRGTFLLDIDNTLLVWWVITTIWWLAQATWPLARTTLVLMGFWWGLSLLMKFTTPLVWPAVFMAIAVSRGGLRRGLRDALLMSVVGIATFLTGWTLVSRVAGIPWHHLFMGRVVDVLLRGATDLGAPMMMELAERGVRLILWIGPVAVLFWGWTTWQLWRRRHHLPAREAIGAALLMGWVLLVGYWIVGGVNWSFAKYHTPLIPLVAALGGTVVAVYLERAHLPRGLVVLAVGCLAWWSAAVVGDLLYLVNQTARHAFLFAPERLPAILRELWMRGGLLLSAPVGVGLVLWLGRSRWNLTAPAVLTLALALGAIGQGLGLGMLQTTASYSTSYCYGKPFATDRAIVESVRASLEAHPQAHLVMLSSLYLAAAGVDCATRPLTCTAWTGHETAEDVLQLLGRADYVLIDPDTNSAHFFRHVLPDARVQAALRGEFEPQSVGTAVAWIRRLPQQG